MISRIISEIAKILSESEGLNFPISIRKNDFWRYKRADDNIFAMASTLFILQQYKTYFSTEQTAEFLEIEKKILSKYSLYQNKDGRKTYNFYQTKPSKHFPNGWLMNRIDHFRLPDDIDDTALVYLTANFTKEETVSLKNLLKEFADNKKEGEVYSTWFGKNMPKEQDICALLNLMYLFHNQNLATEKIDKNTRNFIANQIMFINKNPFEVARHYGNISLIIYHLARFTSSFKSQELDPFKDEMMSLSIENLSREKVFLNKVLIEISLIKWGKKRKKLEVPSNWTDGFYSFIGAPLAPFKTTKWLAQKTISQIFWKSKMHELALLLEYEILCMKQKSE